MNRKLNLSKTAINRTTSAINAALGSDLKRVQNKEAKAYLIYDGEKIEAWLINMSRKDVDYEQAR